MKNGIKIFIIYLIVPIVLSMFFNSLVLKNILLANLLFYLLLLVFFLIYSKENIKYDWMNFKKNIKKYLPIILFWSLVGFVLVMASNYVIQLCGIDLPKNELNNRVYLYDNPCLFLIYALLVAPLIEEYVFRFSLKEIKNYYLFVCVSSFLFCSLHLLSMNNLNDLFYFISYFFMSLGFSNIFFKTQNYFASVLGHIINNTLCAIILLLF